MLPVSENGALAIFGLFQALLLLAVSVGVSRMRSVADALGKLQNEVAALKAWSDGHEQLDIQEHRNAGREREEFRRAVDKIEDGIVDLRNRMTTFFARGYTDLREAAERRPRSRDMSEEGEHEYSGSGQRRRP